MLDCSTEEGAYEEEEAIPSLSMRNHMGGVLTIVSNFQTPERSDLATLPLLGRITVLQAHTHSRITRVVLYGRVTRV